MKKGVLFLAILFVCIQTSFANESIFKKETRQMFRGLKIGVENTATTDQNKNHDISAPIRGEKIDFVTEGAKILAEETGAVIRPRKLRPIKKGRKRPRARRIYLDSPDGKWKVENDSGAMEAPSPPYPVSRLRETKPAFSVFKKLGLKTEVKLMGLWGGGSHFHFDKKPFEHKPLLLRNLIVFLLNNPWIEVVLEEPGDDQARNLRDQGLEELFLKELEIIDRWMNLQNSWTKPDRPLLWGSFGMTFITLSEVAQAMIRAFEMKEPKKWKDYTWDPPVYRYDVESWPPRYTNVNVTNILTGRHDTIEFRRIRALRNSTEVYKVGRLLKSLLMYLYELDEPIEYIKRDRWDVADLEMPEIATQRWPGFIKMLGLKPKDYEFLLKGRFPVLVSAGKKYKNGHSELEIRAGKWTNEDYVYEIRYEGNTKPVISVQIGRKYFMVYYEKIAPRVWIGRLEAPPKNIEYHNAITITARDEKFEEIPRLTGKYWLGNDRITKDEKWDPGEFIPCERLLK